MTKRRRWADVFNPSERCEKQLAVHKGITLFVKRGDSSRKWNKNRFQCGKSSISVTNASNTEEKFKMKNCMNFPVFSARVYETLSHNANVNFSFRRKDLMFFSSFRVSSQKNKNTPKEKWKLPSLVKWNETREKWETIQMCISSMIAHSWLASSLSTFFACEKFFHKHKQKRKKTKRIAKWKKQPKN